MFKLKSMKIGKLYKMTAMLGYDIPLITENGSEVSIVVYG